MNLVFNVDVANTRWSTNSFKLLYLKFSNCVWKTKHQAHS